MQSHCWECDNALSINSLDNKNFGFSVENFKLWLLTFIFLHCAVDKICLVKVRNPAVRHLIDQSRKSRITCDHELVNKIKPRKNKLRLHKTK